MASADDLPVLEMTLEAAEIGYKVAVADVQT